MKKFEVQILLKDQWVCLYGYDTTVVQFDTQKEAQDLLDEMLRDLARAYEYGYIKLTDIQQHRVQEVDAAPMFRLGYQFKVADKNMIITYRFHTGKEWKYHVGLIIGKRGEPVPEPYNTRFIVVERGDVMYVDYCTSDEQEILHASWPW